MDRHAISLLSVHAQSTVPSGLVHNNVRLRNLPSQPVHCIPITEDRSRYGNGRLRGGPGTAHKNERGISSVHSPIARIQILVFGYKGHRDCHAVYVFRSLQYSCVLADPGHVFHHAVLYHNEATNQAHDQVPVHPLYARKAEVSQRRRRR